jgi:hypothetical protein
MFEIQVSLQELLLSIEKLSQLTVPPRSSLGYYYWVGSSSGPLSRQVTAVLEGR